MLRTSTRPRKLVINATLDPEVVEGLNRLAEQEHISRSELLRRLIAQALEDAEEDAELARMADERMDAVRAGTLPTIPWDDAKREPGL